MNLAPAIPSWSTRMSCWRKLVIFACFLTLALVLWWNPRHNSHGPARCTVFQQTVHTYRSICCTSQNTETVIQTFRQPTAALHTHTHTHTHTDRDTQTHTHTHTHTHTDTQTHAHRDTKGRFAHAYAKSTYIM